MVADLRIEERHGALGRAGVALLARQRRKPRQAPGRDRVARRRGLVVRRLWPVIEALVAAPGEEKAAGVGVLELVEQSVGDLGGKGQIARGERRLPALRERG